MPCHSPSHEYKALQCARGLSDTQAFAAYQATQPTAIVQVAHLQPHQLPRATMLVPCMLPQHEERHAQKRHIEGKVQDRRECQQAGLQHQPSFRPCCRCASALPTILGALSHQNSLGGLRQAQMPDGMQAGAWGLIPSLVTASLVSGACQKPHQASTTTTGYETQGRRLHLQADVLKGHAPDTAPGRRDCSWCRP